MKLKNKYELYRYFYDVKDNNLRIIIDDLITEYGLGSVLVEVNGKRYDKITKKYLKKVEQRLNNSKGHQ